MNLCDINVIKAVLARNGFHFTKSLGQNFLTAAWVPERIAEECGASNAFVLEVGPGIGCLTAELAKRAEKVLSVEIDRTLLPVLRETLSGFDNIEVLNADIMKLDIGKACIEKAGALPVTACANLPYYITTPVISLLFEAGIFETVTVMVQKEVAERLTAKPGTKEYGAFTVYAAFHAKTEILFEVPPSCFTPQPKVSSAVVKFNMLKAPPSCISDRDMFFKVVKASFAQRRKTLANCLASAFSRDLSKADVEKLLIDCGVDPSIRGERLSLVDFAKVSYKMKESILQIS